MVSHTEGLIFRRFLFGFLFVCFFSLQMTVVIDVFPAFMFFVSTHPKVPCCLTNGCLLERFQYFRHLFFFFQSTAVVIETSWFWASQIKANALIYCHGYCNCVIHTYSASADFQPFKQHIIAYGRFWSASPAGEENKLIFKTIFLCLSKTIMNMSFLFVKHQRIQ